jgi:subtilase family serine protease
MAEMNIGVTARVNFSCDLFTGASFSLNNHEDVSTIAASDMVSAIWPVTIYPRPDSRIESIINLSDLADETENGTYNDLFPPHVMCGVDKLHAQGYIGEGVSVAIIDTGVDYRYDHCFSVYISIVPINYIDIQH